MAVVVLVLAISTVALALRDRRSDPRTGSEIEPADRKAFDDAREHEQQQRSQRELSPRSEIGWSLLVVGHDGFTSANRVPTAAG